MFGLGVKQLQSSPRNRAAKELVKNLAISASVWEQTIPTENCDIVICLSPKLNDESCDWLVEVLGRTAGILIGRYRDENSGFRALFLTAKNDCLLRAAELVAVQKSVKSTYGGGKAAFSLDNHHIYTNFGDKHYFLTTEERQRIIRYIILYERATKHDVDHRIHDTRLLYEGESILSRLKSKGLINIFPLHAKRDLVDLRKTWVQKLISPQPLDRICDYFGVKVALYFSFLGHYTTALVIPALIGCFVWCYQTQHQSTQDGYFMGFALLNILWSTLFLVSWKRRSAELAAKWGTADGTDELLQEPRPSYTGVIRLNEVTGLTEHYYPPWKRSLFRYFVTLPVISLCLLVVFVLMLMIYQLQDYIKEMILSGDLPRPTRCIPIVLLAVTIPILDSLYKIVALWLNDMENYRLQETYSNHLILKLILFQFVNSFLCLFYTAFYLQDMSRLREVGQTTFHSLVYCM